MAATKTILITGGAKRIGRQIALTLHEAGHSIVVHYRSSAGAAHQLVSELNERRENTAVGLQADLLDPASIPVLIRNVIDAFGRLDVLINNASTFYPTPIELLEEEFWNDLVGSNLRAPSFLAKECVTHLKDSGGSIINILDIHARKPMAKHPIYSSAKAGLEMLTKALALDLAPEVRVNGVSPGAILWPENDSGMEEQARVLEKIPLKRMGKPRDIADLVRFLIDDADYISGQIIAVDGGRSVVI